MATGPRLIRKITARDVFACLILYSHPRNDSLPAKQRRASKPSVKRPFTDLVIYSGCNMMANSYHEHVQGL
ncbi:hypothetical protein PsorP6_012678 [Peronosclerospora sorghi]|uniref:Uncharacterized protein n=1 Tax=Peronosclerospora sorghi TaxID=230839 RepID=A0ACC0WG86_9STRA|nr:hypothetical protein PsorP6_012678 [Peronosclerospora sorghi]